MVRPLFIGFLLVLSTQTQASWESEENRVLELARMRREALSAKENDPNRKAFFDFLEKGELSLAREASNEESRIRFNYYKIDNQFNEALAKFIAKHQIPPSFSGEDEALNREYRDEDGTIKYGHLFSSLHSNFGCSKAKINQKYKTIDFIKTRCPYEFRKLEQSNKKMALETILPLAEHQRNFEEAEKTAADFNNSTFTSTDLGHGYKLTLSNAGIKLIQRYYPEEKNPRLILIGFEGADRIDKDTIVPVRFCTGNKVKGLEFKIGNEIPEDDIIKGRRLIALQVIRIGKKPSTKTQRLSSGELHAFKNFLRNLNAFQSKMLTIFY